MQSWCAFVGLGGVLASLALKNVPSSYVDFVLNGGP